ncbi:choice-of-anchor Q domain-containing protein [Candidatus Halobeggiatoa sp. HSG11]|nr:choice-of-anchor Q domain-containing protein [Candidatus Halobeggiatoa sp. HSG11]
MNYLTFKTKLRFIIAMLVMMLTPLVQANPGGVSTDLQLWFKANAGTSTTTDGAGVTSWTDQSPNTRTADQAIASQQPTFATNAFNFNPTLDFDAAANQNFKLSDLVGLPTGSGDRTMIAVANQTNSVTNPIIFYYGAIVGTQASALSFHSGTGRPVINGGFHFYESTSLTWGDTTPSIISGIYGNGDKGYIYGNGTADASTPFTFTPPWDTVTAAADGYIGENPWVPGADDWNGSVAEIIVYSAALNGTLDLKKIESYLAIKYGITLDSTVNYLASDGSTVIYPSTGTHSGYINDIAGIGRDDASNLDQRKSKSINTDALITIDNGGAFSADNSFLVWGNNDGTVTYNQTSGDKIHLTKIWKVQETGTVGSVTVTISGTNAKYLLVSNSTDFSAATAYSFTGSSTSVDFNAGEFFTLAIDSTPTPGGIGSAPQLWLKADTGVTTGATMTWDDQSPYGLQASQSTGADQPSVVTDAMNFNPALNFDGISDFLTLDSTAYFPTGGNARTMIAVATSTDTGTRVIFAYGKNPPGTGESCSLAVDLLVRQISWSGFMIPYSTAGATWLETPQIAMGTYDAGIGELFVDGQSIWTNTYGTPWNTVLGVGYIGQHFGFGGQFWNGQISEIILYDKALDATERQQVNSYLSLKYGLTLDSGINYLASDGSTVIYPSTGTHSGYINDIAGIGTDTGSDLNQPQSRSVNTDSIVTITGSGIADGNFLIWGNDDGTITDDETTDVPALTSSRLGREWKVQHTNDVGTVTVTMDVNALTLTGTDAVLLVDTDNDGNFTTGTPTQIVADSYTGGIATFTGINLADGNVFTLATDVSCITNPVVTNNADSGTDSLRYAIDNSCATSNITFSIANQTITLSSQLTIDKDLTIDGGTNNITVSGNNTTSIFSITNNSTVVFNTLNIINAGGTFGTAITTGTGTNVTIDGCVLNGNDGNSSPGAIANGGTFNIENSVISNSSSNLGLGTALRGGFSGTINITNSTFYNNNNNVGSSASIMNDLGDTIIIKNTTILDDSTTSPYGSITNLGTLEMYNSIVSNKGTAASDCSGSLAVNVNNLIEDGSCSPTVSGDPLLSALADNGGDTQTMALQAGSPAINAGDNGTCESTDQRDETRLKTVADPCDIGAYEIAIPVAPSALTATAVSQIQINLSWTDNSNNETGFKIERDGSLITTTAADAINYNDTGLTCGTTYNYSVTATNANGDSTATTASATTSACPPNAPTNLNATTVSETQINLSWTDNSNNETGFKIERAGSLITTTASDVTSYSNSSLSCGTTYNYSVTATNVNGDSTATTASATTSVCPVQVTVYHNLTVEKNGNGTIEADYGISCGTDCEHDYADQTELTLTQTSDTGWIFTGWDGDCDSNGEVRINKDKACTATFVQRCETWRGEAEVE